MATEVTEPTTLQITEPGVVDIPADIYHNDPVPGGSLSGSGALMLLPPSTPARYRWEHDHERETKKAWDIGHAAHRLVLGSGPDLVLVDRERWDTKDAKARVAEIRNAGAVPLKAAEWEAVHAMADAIRAHPDASALLNPARMHTERSLFARDPKTGVWLRGRLDAMPPTGEGLQRIVIPDYKTAAAADLDSIERAIYDWGYHVKAAWYTRLVKLLGLATDVAFVLVVQEKKPPHLVNVVQIEPAALRIGDALSRQAIDTYNACVKSGHWPGYEGIPWVGLPAYAERRYTEELNLR